MATKVGPANQHVLLHDHYGHWDCCLCRLEMKVEQFRDRLRLEEDRATDDWAEAESDSHASGYFDGLREALHLLALCGLDAVSPKPSYPATTATPSPPTSGSEPEREG